MDLERIRSYQKASEKDIERQIVVCRKTLSNTIEPMTRQELVEEIRYLNGILDKRRNTKAKKINRVKNAPTVAEHRDDPSGSFRTTKAYI